MSKQERPRRFVCRDCGYGVKCEEDGCCATCGEDCLVVELVYIPEEWGPEHDTPKSDWSSVADLERIEPKRGVERIAALERAILAVQSDHGAGHLSNKTIDAIDEALNGRHR